jgi:hypothetical protein
LDGEPPEKKEALGGSRPMSFIAAAGWTLASGLVTAVAASLVEVAHPGALRDVVTLTALRVLGYSLVFFGVLRVHEPESSVRRVLALRWPGVLVVLLAVLAGAALMPAGGFLEAAYQAKFPSPPDPEPLELGTKAQQVAYVVAAVGVVPTVSELFFHGALFTPLRRGRRVDTVVFATAAFAVLDIQDGATVVLSVLVLVAAAWVRGLSASVVPAVLARVAFVAAAILPAVFGRDLPPMTPGIVLAGVAVAALSVLAIAGLSARDRRIRERAVLEEHG